MNVCFVQMLGSDKPSCWVLGSWLLWLQLSPPSEIAAKFLGDALWQCLASIAPCPFSTALSEQCFCSLSAPWGWSRGGADISCVLSSCATSPHSYLALYAYKPQKNDELELRKGEMYRVIEKCQDGWFKGTSLRSGMSGVFPGNYVTPVSRWGPPASVEEPEMG